MEQIWSIGAAGSGADLVFTASKALFRVRPPGGAEDITPPQVIEGLHVISNLGTDSNFDQLFEIARRNFIEIDAEATAADLALLEAKRRWRHINGWKAALNYLAIAFEDRIARARS